MLEGFNEWYIDMDLTPMTEQLEARQKGIAAFAKKAAKEDICDLIRIFFDLPVSTAFKEKFAKTFSEIDPAFSARNDVEMKLLAGAELVYLTECYTEYSAMAELFVMIMADYRQSASSTMILDRLRLQFDRERIFLRTEEELDEGDYEGDQIKTSIDALEQELGDGPDWSTDVKDKLIEVLNELREKIDADINDLRQEVSVFKEDSQILWWMNAHWSNTYNVPLKHMEKSTMCLPIGVEAADFISNYPGPFSMKGVICHALDNCKGKSSALSLAEVMKATGKDWKNKQTESVEEEKILPLLPIHAAIVRSQNTTSDEQWYPKYMEEILLGEKFQPIEPKEYAWRVYLEELAINCYGEL